MDFEPDRKLMEGAAFRLSWPGESPAALPSLPVGKKKKKVLADKLKAATSKATAKLPFRRRQMPQRTRRTPGPFAALTTLGRKLKSRKVPCLGWPISLSVPGPEDQSFLPRVKMTGQPLD